MKHIQPVIQEEQTDCAIAATAALAGVSYASAKNVAKTLGITASDSTLWSNTSHIRKLLSHYNINTRATETPFTTWKALPNLALLAIKWHKEKGTAYWHWVVFIRDTNGEYVLDSKKSLCTNIRTDFGRMNPKWFIAIAVHSIHSHSTD